MVTVTEPSVRIAFAICREPDSKSDFAHARWLGRAADTGGVVFQSAFLTGAVLLAQLDPMSGTPLASGNATSVQSAQTELVKLPRSFGVNQRVLAEHGTAIYKLGEWKSVCPVANRAKPTVVLMDDVLFEERRGMNYVVRMKSGERSFALSCRVAPVRGRFTLIFVDPGHTKSAALAARTPDYVVP